MDISSILEFLFVMLVAICFHILIFYGAYYFFNIFIFKKLVGEKEDKLKSATKEVLKERKLWIRILGPFLFLFVIPSSFIKSILNGKTGIDLFVSLEIGVLLLFVSITFYIKLIRSINKYSK